ncbi:hypothetical protein D1872_298280 [compost metagenome]
MTEKNRLEQEVPSFPRLKAASLLPAGQSLNGVLDDRAGFVEFMLFLRIQVQLYDLLDSAFADDGRNPGAYAGLAVLSLQDGGDCDDFMLVV